MSAAPLFGLASGWDERASGAARDLIPETVFLR
jgi:hypothetical protein